MAKDVLREYLMSIGFKIDEAGFKKYKDNIKEAEKRSEEFTKRLKQMAEIASAAAVEIGAGAIAIADRMEKVYYASKLSETSATNFKAFTEAAEQIGISAETAGQALEGFASRIRQNPGLKGYVRALGVDPNQKDQLKVFLGVLTQLSKMPYNVGAVRAQGLFGIDEQTFRMFTQNRGEFEQYLAQYQKLNAGMDADAEKAHKFQQELRDVENRFERLAVTVGERFLPLLEKAIPLLDKTIDFFIQADKATDGWSSKLLGVAAAITSIVGTKAALSGVLSMLGIGGGGAAAGGVGTAVAEGSSVAVGGAATATGGYFGAGIIGLGLKSLIDSHSSNLMSKAKMEEIGAYNRETIAYRRKKGLFVSTDHPAGPTISSGTATLGDAPFNNPGNLRSWGATPTVERIGASGKSIGKFANFSSAFEGLSAMAGQLLRYSQRGLDSVSKIVSTYAPKSENDTQAYIRDIAKRLGVTSTDHLNIQDPATLQRLMAAMIHHEQGFDPYNTKLIGDAANARLTKEGYGVSSPVTIQQKTDIHVDGAGDPRQASRLVIDGQDRVNGDLVRNFQGVVN